MTATLLLDDHLLLRVLLDDEPVELRPTELHPNGASLATTGLWYHRLCRALATNAVVGSLSRRLGDVDDAVAAGVVSAVVELPDTVELISLRALAWPMGVLVDAGVRLNLLSLEALTAAMHLDAEICLATVDDNEPLRSAAHALDVPVRAIPG